ncbi:TrkH family potassium uptake protein [Treponema sp.]
MTGRDRITFIAFALSIAALFLERAIPFAAMATIIHILDFAILALILVETFMELRGAVYRWNYIRQHAGSLLFITGFTALFLYSKYLAFFDSGLVSVGALPEILRNSFLVIKIVSRFRKLFKLAERMAIQPAQTIAVSFILVILSGALVLMMGFSTTNGEGLSFLNAAFTATSAVCVTGLIVVDTAVDLSRVGQSVVLLLIQIGGLGIMAFSFFAMFAFRKTLSVKDRLTVSYMLGDDDMSNLSHGLRTIILSTFGIEALGALLLLTRFVPVYGFGSEAIFRSVFHSVSAFCNAGFALYTDSLESFRQDALLTLSIAALIVLGGISFGVMRDARAWLAQGLRRLLRRGDAPLPIASVNSRAVITLTGVLLLVSFCGFYLLEHSGVMANYSLGEQYLASVFQAVTLRTAGFNSVSFGTLRDGTLLFMVLFMFIGGASGSTAGGIKVNSLAAMGAYFRSFLRQESSARIGNSTISSEKIGKAFLILLFGLTAVFIGTLILSLTEKASFLNLLFEAVSAFGTVGLSTGITASLSPYGKSIIMLLMFLGRLGPLTILAAASKASERGHVEYPLGDLAIG